MGNHQGARVFKPWCSHGAVGQEVGLELFVFDCQRIYGFTKRLHLRQDALGVFLKELQRKNVVFARVSVEHHCEPDLLVHTQSERGTEVVIAHIVGDGLGHRPRAVVVDNQLEFVAELWSVCFLVFLRQHRQCAARFLDAVVSVFPGDLLHSGEAI